MSAPVTLETLATDLHTVQGKLTTVERHVTLLSDIVLPIYYSHLFKGAARTIFWSDKTRFGRRLPPADITLLDELVRGLQRRNQPYAEMGAMRIFKAMTVNGVGVTLGGVDGDVLSEAKAAKSQIPKTPHHLLNLKPSKVAHLQSIPENVLKRLAQDVSLPFKLLPHMLNELNCKVFCGCL
jgi:hypothetical protein